MPINEREGKTGTPVEAAPELKGKILAACPTVVEYLALERYASGKPRERSTMSVFIEHGQVRLCLNDRDVGESMWVSGDSLEAALASLEKRLAGGSTEWRPNRPQGGKRK